MCSLTHNQCTNSVLKQRVVYEVQRLTKFGIVFVDDVHEESDVAGRQAEGFDFGEFGV